MKKLEVDNENRTRKQVLSRLLLRPCCFN